MKSASCMFFSPAGPSGPTPRPSALVFLSKASKSSTLQEFIKADKDVKKPESFLSFKYSNIAVWASMLPPSRMAIPNHEKNHKLGNLSKTLLSFFQSLFLPKVKVLSIISPAFPLEAVICVKTISVAPLSANLP